ncbi:MAG: AAA family ATPase [Byssovorax sp.]
MITRLTVENFKCLQKTSLDLGPFTVLIGANDSGKSSLLDAIHVLGRTVNETLAESLSAEEGEPAGSFDELVWRRDETRKIGIAIEATSGTKKFSYSLALAAGPELHAEKIESKDGSVLYFGSHSRGPDTTSFNAVLRQKTDGAPMLREIVHGFASTAKYRFEPHAIRRVAPLASNPRLTRTGDNLPEALDAIFTGPDRTAAQKLESALHAAIPTLSGLALRTVRAAGVNTISKVLDFVLAGTSPPVTIPATQASEGALMLTAFLTLAYGDTPEVLLIEEPENGLHPTRLQTVIDLLRQISTGAVGNRPRQVIMTTHSPLLLNYLKPEEVRIVRRDPERGTEVTPMIDVPNIDRMLGEFGMGELWYLLTEEGLLKGEEP